MSKNVVEKARLQMTIWRRVACWISKATRAQAHTHTQKYIIFTAFPLQRWFRESCWMLRHAYIAYLVLHPLGVSLYPWLLYSFSESLPDKISLFRDVQRRCFGHMSPSQSSSFVTVTLTQSVTIFFGERCKIINLRLVWTFRDIFRNFWRNFIHFLTCHSNWKYFKVMYSTHSTF